MSVSGRVAGIKWLPVALRLHDDIAMAAMTVADSSNIDNLSRLVFMWRGEVNSVCILV